jgi:Calcineurin-like phosphoesterase
VSAASPSSSRESSAGAGWDDCGGPGAWKADVPVNAKPNSWFRPSTLWAARNDILAKHLYDPVDRARVAWVRLARERATKNGDDADFVIRREQDGPVSFLLLGDPGEGDDSQYAVVPPLLSQAAGVDFTVVCSDVIYPAGEISDYRTKFFRPYRDLDCPVYAVPGNHDWYDGLHGFMSHVCGIDTPAAPLEVGPGVRAALTRRLWRRTMAADPDDLAAMRRDRSRPVQMCDPVQPGPYWAMDVGPLRIVGIDTGIVGSIDAEQAEWLRRVSLGSERPKVLVTGKPLIVNGHRVPPAVGERVEAVVRDPQARYVMAIGGDTHNYQRYPVELAGGRVIHYVVSGGGGAYTHATHQIDRVDVDGVTEDRFKCYPLRSDSLARFSQLYDARLAGGRGRLELTPAEAATYLSELLKLDPTRETKVALSPRARTTARLLQPAPAKHGFHRFASEYFDWNDPPFFKQFLRLDADAGELRVRCFGVSGCRHASANPPVEDEFTVRL